MQRALQILTSVCKCSWPHLFCSAACLDVKGWISFVFVYIDTLCAVLQRDTLSIRENRLFGAVVRWAEAECYRQQLPATSENKQKVLGKALPLIRFPLMTVEEFAAGKCFVSYAAPVLFLLEQHYTNQLSHYWTSYVFVIFLYNSNHRNQLDILSCTTGPAQSGILFDREVVNLFLHFTVNPKPRVDYIDRPRCCLRGEECSINRFQQVESRWGYSGTSDRIRWENNHKPLVITLTQLKLFLILFSLSECLPV